MSDPKTTAPIIKEVVHLPNTAVLLVGHGSRNPTGNAHFLALAERVRPFVAPRPLETCFIELADPPIPVGIERAVATGARSVAVLPLTLFAAGHAKLEVPEHLDRARSRYPGVQFQYGRPLGTHPLLIEILAAYIEDALVGTESVPRNETMILLVGRGASDGDANSDLYKAARLLWEFNRSRARAEPERYQPFRGAEGCFIGVTEPDLQTGIARCVALGASRVVVVPYFLFTGVLMERMQGYTQEAAAAHPEVTFLFAGEQGMGNHPLLLALLKERLAETLAGTAAMNCDACQYRLAAGHHHHPHDHGHGHGHHHDHD